MDPFTKTTGYPVVSIDSTANPTEFSVQQTRFFSSGKVQSESEAQVTIKEFCLIGQKWWVSLGVRTSKSKDVVSHELKNQKETMTFPEVADTEWFKVNADQSGFYRVKYSCSSGSLCN